MLPGVVVCEDPPTESQATSPRCPEDPPDAAPEDVLKDVREEPPKQLDDFSSGTTDQVEFLAELPQEPRRLQPEASDGKLSGSMGSTASTCTPHANASGAVAAFCHQCGLEADLYLDTSDMKRYCSDCWKDYYGHTPGRSEASPLIGVEVAETVAEERLSQLWSEKILPGWPPVVVPSTPARLGGREGQEWSSIKVRVHRQVVGAHAREQNNGEGHPLPGEVLAERYRVKHLVGEGHFTKAFMAEDEGSGGDVCLKRHRTLSVEALVDLFVLGKRIAEHDEGGHLFPLLTDAFYDVVGYTVETLIEGHNCLSLAKADAGFFKAMKNLRHVAVGTLRGLVALEQAGAVHNDVKPDNLIWTQECVKVVDFGCARLDSRVEPKGRNWALSEGGAGHLGKWSPEMVLRLPITHASDVWGMAISLCELYCGRFMWRNEADTAEVVLAQSLGLCSLRGGLPPSLLRRSPLDVRQLYTPAPCHYPVRQNAEGQLEVLRPVRWGLEQVIGEGWRENDKAELGQLLETALVVDAAHRPSAAKILECCPFVCSSPPDEIEGLI